MMSFALDFKEIYKSHRCPLLGDLGRLAYITNDQNGSSITKTGLLVSFMPDFSEHDMDR